VVLVGRMPIASVPSMPVVPETVNQDCMRPLTMPRKSYPASVSQPESRLIEKTLVAATVWERAPRAQSTLRGADLDAVRRKVLRALIGDPFEDVDTGLELCYLLQELQVDLPELFDHVEDFRHERLH